MHIIINYNAFFHKELCLILQSVLLYVVIKKALTYGLPLYLSLCVCDILCSACLYTLGVKLVGCLMSVFICNWLYFVLVCVLQWMVTLRAP